MSTQHELSLTIWKKWQSHSENYQISEVAVLKFVALGLFKDFDHRLEAVSVVVVVGLVLIIISDDSIPEVPHIIQVRIPVKHASSKTQLHTLNSDRSQ